VDAFKCPLVVQWLLGQLLQPFIKFVTPNLKIHLSMFQIFGERAFVKNKTRAYSSPSAFTIGYRFCSFKTEVSLNRDIQAQAIH
jgi:hypothetical protein